MTIDATVGFNLTNSIYLLAHSVGRPPLNARASAEKFFDLWEFEEDNWPGWMQGIEQFRVALGQLFNSDKENFCPQTNVSSALTKVLYSLPQQKGRKTILLSEHDFPSLGFVMDRAKKMGFKLKFIPQDSDHTDLSVWDDYLSNDILCALVTHVHSNSSCQVPVKGITDLTRKKGIFSIVDICQSAGNVPIDLDLWTADCVLGSCVKWLCGGPGAGFLWVDPAAVKMLEPVDVGWFSHQNPMAFDIHHFEYADSALRFWGGTPSVIPFMIASNSIQHMTMIGIDVIRQHNLTLTRSIIDAIPGSYLRTSSDDEHRGGTLVIDFGANKETIINDLKNAKVIFDERSTGIRMSPHFYNTAEDIDRVLDIIGY